MNGAMNKEVPWGLWIATVFGANSPKTTCRKEMIPKLTARATGCSIPSGKPNVSKRGSMSVATAGSPIQPSPREEMVIPNWQTAR